MMTKPATDRMPLPTSTAMWGWRILVAVSALLVLNGLLLYFFIADSALMRLVSTMESGAALLALTVAWEGLRRGTRWAWKALWAYCALLLALAIQILLGGDVGVGLYYLSLAGSVLTGQLLVARGGWPS